MSDLSTIARRHAEEVRAAVADARLPQLDNVRGGVPRPAWAVLAAVLILLAFGLPALLGSDQPELEVPVVATTIPEPDVVGTSVVETSAVTVGPGGGFIPTGSMSRSCSWCPGVLLDDRRVLILGSAWAEIYDPVTWTFTLLEGNQAQRVPGAGDALLLKDGRVLVVGPPIYAHTGPSIVEIFDPASGTFRLIERPRGEGSAAVRLTDGRVLIFGNPAGPTIFDPVDETFTVTGPARIREPVEAVLLDDGRVLIFSWEGETELYDPDTHTLTPTGSMTAARSGFTVTKLADGRVLIVGGGDVGPKWEEWATAELYDPDTGAFTQTGSMARARASHAAALLPDGRVLVVGGWGLDGESQTTAEIYDPVTGLFSEAPPPTTRRLASTAVPLADGTVLIFGHYSGNVPLVEGGSKSAEIFTLGTIERPVECCGENPTVITIRADVGWDPAEVNLVVPSGGLEGATEAGYQYSYGSSGIRNAPGNLSYRLARCADGCVIPLDGAVGKVTVEIAYEGTPPDESSEIRISFEPGG